MTNQQSSINIPGIAVLHAHIEGLIANTQGNAYWKDKSGVYLGANDAQIINSGSQSHENLIGATDYDLIWKEFAPLLIDNDYTIMADKAASIFIEPVRIINTEDTTQTKISKYLSYKPPLLNQKGKIIGIFGLSYLLDNLTDNSKYFDEIALIAGKSGVEMSKRTLWLHQKSISRLTDRQLGCLEHLAKGMTNKQIGEALSLSSRTVEHYLEAIKVKLNCSSRLELIEAAKYLGLL